MQDAVRKILRYWALALLLCGLVWASVGGSISGTVKDSSGAVIPKAVVTALNIETGVQQSVATDTTGAYTFPILPIGHYEVSVAHPGFKPYQRTGIEIDA